MADIKFDDEVDITDKVCPLTFVKAKVAIEELDDGEVLAIRMNDGEPVQNVPRSMKEEGHKILKLEDNEDGTYTLGDVEDDYEDKINVYKVNTNFDADLAEKYEVTANPTLLFVKNGEVVDRTVGFQKPADLKTLADSLLKS